MLVVIHMETEDIQGMEDTEVTVVIHTEDMAIQDMDMDIQATVAMVQRAIERVANHQLGNLKHLPETMREMDNKIGQLRIEKPFSIKNRNRYHRVNGMVTLVTKTD